MPWRTVINQITSHCFHTWLSILLHRYILWLLVSQLLQEYSCAFVARSGYLSHNAFISTPSIYTYSFYCARAPHTKTNNTNPYCIHFGRSITTHIEILFAMISNCLDIFFISFHFANDGMPIDNAPVPKERLRKNFLRFDFILQLLRLQVHEINGRKMQKE